MFQRGGCSEPWFLSGGGALGSVGGWGCRKFQNFCRLGGGVTYLCCLYQCCQTILQLNLYWQPLKQFYMVRFSIISYPVLSVYKIRIESCYNVLIPIQRVEYLKQLTEQTVRFISGVVGTPKQPRTTGISATKRIVSCVAAKPCAPECVGGIGCVGVTEQGCCACIGCTAEQSCRLGEWVSVSISVRASTNVITLKYQS